MELQEIRTSGEAFSTWRILLPSYCATILVQIKRTHQPKTTKLTPNSEMLDYLFSQCETRKPKWEARLFRFEPDVKATGGAQTRATLLQCYTIDSLSLCNQLKNAARMVSTAVGIQSKATRSKLNRKLFNFQPMKLSKLHTPSFDPVIYHTLGGRNVKINLRGYSIFPSR